MINIQGIVAAVTLVCLLTPTIGEGQAPGRITGVGGIFVTSKDPKALAAWYRDVLGTPLETWGGAVLRYDATSHSAMVLWNAMPANSEEIAPSTRDFMVNFTVDNLGAFIGRLKAKGVPILKRDDADPFGKFAWIMDPDGVKIELWQPKAE